MIIIVAGIGYYFYIYNKPAETSDTDDIEIKQALILDSKKESTHLSKVEGTEGVYFVRMFDMTWNEVESKKGKFDWDMPDSTIEKFSSDVAYPLVIVKPFANWDQDACHDETYAADFDPQKGGSLKVGKPCDMDAYKVFLKKAVERYDGDGENDMPGLEIPIKYWEIMNEPSMQGGSTGDVGEELKFFVGTSQEYFDILKTSYQVIKKADPNSSVLHAGMAGMQQNFQDFWDPVFEKGAGNYFDIANIHTINTDDNRHDMYIIKFKEYLKKYNITDKLIWVTEVQFGELTSPPKDLESFEKTIVKSTVFALAQGADKLFYIENWLFWQEGGWTIEDDKKENPKDKSEDPHKPNPKQLKSSTHKTYLNLVNFVNEFDEIVKIKEEHIENTSDRDGATSNIGQYKFINGDDVVYVLWGDAELPLEISGTVTLTDIYGSSQKIKANKIYLTDTPIFVEK